MCHIPVFPQVAPYCEIVSQVGLRRRKGWRVGRGCSLKRPREAPSHNFELMRSFHGGTSHFMEPLSEACLPQTRLTHCHVAGEGIDHGGQVSGEGRLGRGDFLVTKLVESSPRQFIIEIHHKA